MSAHVIGVGLAASQVALFALMVSTSDSGNDPFDSPLYWCSWLLWPACGLAAGFTFPRSPAWLWAGVLAVPFAVGVALLGTIWHDPNDGASLWIAGEMFVAVNALVTYGAASAGASLGSKRAHRGA